jgi:hypothetical protein
MRFSHAAVPPRASRLQERKTPYDIATMTNNLAVRAQLRPNAAPALRNPTVGAALERERLASQMGLSTPIGVVPDAVNGETTAAQQAAQQAELDAAAGVDSTTMVAPPHQEFLIPTRLDIANIHPHLLPAHVGQERVLLLEALSDKARCLSLSPYAMLQQAVPLDLKLCFWPEARPRSYVRVTENSFETNMPVIACPCECCLLDRTEKVYFDRMLHQVPFRAKCCSPYNFCCGRCEPCGEVVVFAPHSCMANEACLLFLPPCFKIFPGLEDADALVDFVKLARGDFIERKIAHEKGSCIGCLLGPRNKAKR